MPKKRHQTKFTKPQSTPPPSLASSRNRTADEDADHVRGVNEILADLRRVRVTGSGGAGASSAAAGQSDQGTPSAAAQAGMLPSPSVPPALRQILQLPEPPAPPRPRVRRPVDARGRRFPPGPPAPRSWLAQSRHAPRPWQRPGRPGVADGDSDRLVLGVDFTLHRLPVEYVPESRSLVDLATASLAADWEFQRQYNKHWLYTLPDHLRTTIVSYLGACRPAGVSVADLKALFLPPPDSENVTEDGAVAHNLNEGIQCLDLMGSLGKSIELKELAELLYPRDAPQEAAQASLQDSWDAPEISPTPRWLLLPNLTRLSLAVNPSLSHRMSWKQLLSFSSRCPTLTHLSLAYWPTPTLTPNAVGAVVESSITPQQFQYGGTGAYSHSLDDDWTEAIMVLKRLSRNLYGLEHLDLTGCAAWTPALMKTSDHDAVDWVGAWGKATALLLHWGFVTPEPGRIAETARYRENVATAGRIERHIVSTRGGRGRLIEVGRDRLPEM